LAPNKDIFALAVVGVSNNKSNSGCTFLGAWAGQQQIGMSLLAATRIQAGSLGNLFVIRGKYEHIANLKPDLRAKESYT